ncbi:MAG TPA: metalloregulator ArsR/SmtB family transcription factor [Kofleriaceae bacterium]|nr:metalloregulator ArsR/SmtB family transcription factor [Kofleriaceae bacterium]
MQSPNQPPNQAPDQALDRLFGALADPSRRMIIERLSRRPSSVSELAAPLAMSLPAVMQHLQVLEASGLVRSEKVGRVRTCRVEAAALATVEQWIFARRATWERRLDRLGALLDGLDDLDGSGGPGGPGARDPQDGPEAVSRSRPTRRKP